MLSAAKCRGYLFGSPGYSVGAGHGHRKHPRAAVAQMPAKGCRPGRKNWQGEKSVSKTRNVKGASYSLLVEVSLEMKETFS